MKVGFWHQGLLPGLNYVGEPYKAGDTTVEETGWIARALIGRIKKLL
ncbi:hypothetical protein [Paenibacillus sp. GP183]|nr:hypothetical protein [Paenibacillus sp. GP183]